MSRNEEFLNQIASRDWFHGTDQEGADEVARSQRADFRGIQVHGPGFYVTPNVEQAAEYARNRAEYSGRAAVIQSGIPMIENPVQVTARKLEGIGRQFRQAHPHVSDLMHDAALGNIALRQRGHDFMHVVEGVYGDPIDVGVILRPNKWLAMEDREVRQP